MPNIKLPPIATRSKKPLTTCISPRFTKPVSVPPNDDLQAFFDNVPTASEILFRNRERKKRKLLGQVAITIAEARCEV